MTANILLGADEKGMTPHATLIASIMRRSSIPVHVRCYCRMDIIPRNFKVRNLTVEFLPVRDALAGAFPAHVTQPCLDRFLGIRECDDWDRALVLDWDQLFEMDIAEFFERDMKDNLIGAKLDHNTIGSALTQWFGRKIPSQYAEQAKTQKWPWLGCMLNLSKMRDESFWDKFVETHNSLGFEEQMTLAFAVDGSIDEWPPRYNSVFQWDGSIEKHNEGRVLHFTMPNKPWGKHKVPAQHIWERERSTWDDLVLGEW